MWIPDAAVVAASAATPVVAYVPTAEAAALASMPIAAALVAPTSGVNATVSAALS